jgi:hypothetical protein
MIRIQSTERLEMIELACEMTYAETIAGPLGPTTGSALGERLCWQITNATLHGARIDAFSDRLERVSGAGDAGIHA